MNSQRNQYRSRPYPWRCHECREVAVQRALEQRTVKTKYDGRLYELDIAEFPVNRCTVCGAATHDMEADDVVDRALRDHLNLLHPEEIRAKRDALGLKQQQLAETIGCAVESLSRWECGSVIQSRGYDRLLRAFFSVPELRNFLAQMRATTAFGEFASAATTTSVDWFSVTDDFGRLYEDVLRSLESQSEGDSQWEWSAIPRQTITMKSPPKTESPHYALAA